MFIDIYGVTCVFILFPISAFRKVVQEAASLRRDRAAEEQKLEQHWHEIECLECEMQHLWAPHYAPPVRLNTYIYT